MVSETVVLGDPPSLCAILPVDIDHPFWGEGKSACFFNQWVVYASLWPVMIFSESAPPMGFCLFF